MALKIFHEMKSQKCTPDICTYTALVNAFARDGLCEKAEEIFEQLQDAGYEPDVYAYNALMEAYRLLFESYVYDLSCLTMFLIRAELSSALLNVFFQQPCGFSLWCSRSILSHAAHGV